MTSPKLSAEDEAIHQKYLAAVNKMNAGGFESLTDADHEAFASWWAVQRRLRKEAERPVAIPGLDVIWWKEDPPLRVWTAHGLVCALGQGYKDVNGYVCLPPGHPWREANLQGFSDDEEIPEIAVHGGITFGPHVTGWIGFDTGHAWDYWSIEELIRAGVDDEVLASAQRWLGMGIPRRRDSWDVDWTVEMVVAETEDLARQVAEATP